MRHTAFVATLILTVVPTVFAQQFKYESFPYNETILHTYGESQKGPGCGCGINSSTPIKQLRQMSVSPTAVRTPTGQSVQIRYDASGICRGQGIKDSNDVDYSDKKNFSGVGSVMWETGVIQPLPDIWGVVTYSGFTQTTDHSIKFDIKLQCWDAGAANCKQSCSASAEIPVTILRRSEKPPK